MGNDKRISESALHDEAVLRWGFLEDEREACAAVSDRMELVYLNEAARELVPTEWFGRRCFEVFPAADKLCAFSCPTIEAVHEAKEIRHCHESLRLDNGVSRELEVAVIPLGDQSRRATAVLLLQNREIQLNPAEDEKRLFAEAARIQSNVLKKLGPRRASGSKD